MSVHEVDLWDRTAGEVFAAAVLRAGTHDRATAVEVEMRALLETTGDGGEWSSGTLSTPTWSRRPGRFIRDLLTPVPWPRGTIAAVVQEVNTSDHEGGASATPEGSAKPEVTMEFDVDELSAGKVAAWVPATDEVMQDAPGLAAYVDNRLGEMVGIRENGELLNGDGTGERMTGFLEAGIDTGSAGADYGASIGSAIATIEGRGGFVDGIVTNTSDYWAARGDESQRASGLFDDAGNVHGIPTVRTAEIAAGHTLVGSFRTGAVLREKSPVTIRFGDQHADWLVLGKVLIVGELREALGLHRLDWFVDQEV